MALDKVTYSFACELDRPVNWRVLEVQLEEALSTPYRASVALRVEGPVDFDVVGTSCVLQLQRGQRPPRRLCGIVHRARHDALPDGHAHLALEVGPALLALAHGADARVFCQMTAPQIVDEVLREGLAPYDRGVQAVLTRSYPKREFCLQYGESHLDFVTRLLHEEGINYHFDHGGDVETLVLCDDNASFAAASAPLAISWPLGAVLHEEHVTRFASERRQQRTGATFVDYDWTRPPKASEQTHGSADTRDQGRLVRVHRDGATSAEAGTLYALQAKRQRVVTEAERYAVDAQVQRGCASFVTALVPGLVVDLVGHPEHGRNGTYVVTEVEHLGRPEGGEAVSGAQNADYANTFCCVPYELPCRPTVQPPAPILPGVQTATVVGPYGEEIWTDEHGRVKLRFPWDRRSHKHTDFGPWVRVLQGWAGSAFGAVTLPRVGMEVLVAFVDGHAQRPVVLGCAFNGGNQTPYELPAKKTRTVMRTRSTPGQDPDAYNELSFEDALRNEEIFVRAQRNLRVHVRNSHLTHVELDRIDQIDGLKRVSVQHDASWDLGHDASTKVKRDRSSTIGGHDATEVGGDRHVDVHGNHGTEVQGNFALEVKKALEAAIGRDAHVTVQGSVDAVVKKGANYHLETDLNCVVGNECNTRAKKVVLKATESYRIEQGAASIVLKKGEVHIEGSKIFLNGKSISLVAKDTLRARGKCIDMNGR